MTDDNKPIDKSQLDDGPDDAGKLMYQTSDVTIVSEDESPLNGVLELRYPSRVEIVNAKSSRMELYIPKPTRITFVFIRLVTNDGELLLHMFSPIAEVGDFHEFHFDLPVGVSMYDITWMGVGPSGQINRSIFASDLPVITDLGVTQVNVIGGAGGKDSGKRVVQEGTDAKFSMIYNGPGNDWRINLVDALAAGKYRVAIEQIVEGYPVRYSLTHDFTYYKAPVILTPASGGIYDTNLVIRGSGGIPDEVIVVMKPGGAVKHGEATVKKDGTWEAPFINQDHYPAGGDVTITAAYEKAIARLGCWSSPRTFFLLAKPVITAPEANTVQDTTFTLSGNNATPGSTVDVLIDTTNERVGGTGLLSEGSWSCPVSVSVGLVSLVVLQKRGNTPSARSASRTFKIRPAPPSSLSAVVTSPTVVFKGGGHTGATVSISGMGFMGTPPTANVNMDKSWQITTTMLPASAVRTYTVQQDVADGTGGRILSAPVSGTVTVPTPAPTGTTCTLDSNNVPRLRGTTPVWQGYQVMIDVNLGAIGVVNSDTNGNWSAIGKSALHPGTHTPTIRMIVNGQWSGYETLPPIVIRPLAPDSFVVTPDGLSPNIAGKCWPSAKVQLRYSDELPALPAHEVNGPDGEWSFRRDILFTPGNHTVTVTQSFGGQTSPAAAPIGFNVATPQLKVTDPTPGEEVSLRPTIKGIGAYAGSVIKIYDAKVADKVLGQQAVGESGGWSITLTEEFKAEGSQSFYVLQVYEKQESARSEPVPVSVRLPKPLVQVPQVKVERHAEYSGHGWPNATITLTRVGVPDWEVNVLVDEEGVWKVQVTVPEVGPQTLAITQNYKTIFSRAGDDTTFTVVPNLPFLETPAEGERLTLRPMFSGFGYPGDTVSVVKNNEAAVILGTALVSDKGTWFVRSDIDLPVGLDYQFSVQQGRGEHVSAFFPTRTFHVLNQGPSVDEPISGDWVGLYPWVCGRDEPGARITVASVFDAQEVLAPVTTVDGSGHWRVQLDKPLLVGPNWVQARADRGVAKGVSDWARSGRFMVEKAEDDFDPPTVSIPPLNGEVGLTPLLQGSGLPGARITIYVGSTLAAQTSVDREGQWAARINNPLPVIDHLTGYVVRSSRDGKSSRDEQRKFKVVQVPAGFPAPIIVSPQSGVEVDPHFWIQGTALPGARVEIHKRGVPVLVTTHANAAGEWQVCINPALPLGEFEFLVVQWLDGQMSQWGEAINVQVKADLPPPLEENIVDGMQVLPVTNIRGRGYPGATVTLRKSGDPSTSWGSALVNASGYWEIWTKPLPLGPFRFGGNQEISGKPGSPGMKEFVVHVVNAG